MVPNKLLNKSVIIIFHTDYNFQASRLRYMFCEISNSKLASKHSSNFPCAK